VAGDEALGQCVLAGSPWLVSFRDVRASGFRFFVACAKSMLLRL
jgi:hypothetical protein